MNKYYTLLTRENAGEPWGVHFGDFDKDVVSAERDDITHWDWRRSDTRIITTNDDQQETINAAVEQMNASAKEGSK
jgi:hypothetical protein